MRTVKEILEQSETNKFIRLFFQELSINYSNYNGKNRFYGTPVPEGYEAEYVPAKDCALDNLQLRRKPS